MQVRILILQRRFVRGNRLLLRKVGTDMVTVSVSINIRAPRVAFWVIAHALHATLAAFHWRECLRRDSGKRPLFGGAPVLNRTGAALSSLSRPQAESGAVAGADRAGQAALEGHQAFAEGHRPPRRLFQRGLFQLCLPPRVRHLSQRLPKRPRRSETLERNPMICFLSVR